MVTETRNITRSGKGVRYDMHFKCWLQLPEEIVFGMDFMTLHEILLKSAPQQARIGRLAGSTIPFLANGNVEYISEINKQCIFPHAVSV